MGEDHTYDAFMSYSHQADRQVAPTLQRLIRRVGRPWYAGATLRIFLDQTNMPISETLWGTIEEALSQSRYFVLLACPESAKSAWVAREVGYWRANRDRSTFFIVHTGGNIAWNGETGDFYWGPRTDALPTAIAGWFTEEPVWVSIIPTAGEAVDRKLRKERLRDVARTIAAPIHGLDKDQLDGEDAREIRRARRTRRGGLAALALLIVVAVLAASVALTQSREASTQARTSQARRLASIAVNELGTNLDVANLLAVRAFRTDPNPQTRGALLRAAITNGQLVRFLPFDADVKELATSADGSTVVVGLADGSVMRWRLTESAPEPLFELGLAAVGLAVSANGDVVAGTDGTSTQLLLPHQPPTALPVTAGWKVAAVAVSSSGRTVAVSTAEDRFEGQKSITIISQADGRIHQVDHELDDFMIPPDFVVVSDENVLLLDGGYGDWEWRQLAGWERLAQSSAGFGTANYGVTTSADGSSFSYTNGGATVPVWRTDRPTEYSEPPLEALAQSDSLPQAIALNGDATRLAVAEGGTIHVATVGPAGVPQMDPVRLVGAGTVNEDGLRFFGTNQRKLASAVGNQVALWDLDQTDRIGRSVPVPVSAGCNACGPPSVAVSPDGTRIAVVDGGGWTGAIGPLGQPDHFTSLPAADLALTYGTAMWDADGHRATVLVQPPPGGIQAPIPEDMPDSVRALPAGLRASGVAAAGMTSDGKQIIVVQRDGGLDLVDPISGATRTLIPDPGAPAAPKMPDIAAAAVSSTANLVAITDGKAITVRDARTGRDVGQTQQNDVSGLVFIPGHLLVQHGSGELAVWDEKVRQLDHVIAGAQSWLPAASPNGTLIARAGWDASITLTDQESGTVLATIPASRPGAKIGVGFAGNGTRLVTVAEPDDTGPATAVYRDITDEHLVRTACATAGRDLTAGEWHTLMGEEVPADLTCH